MKNQLPLEGNTYSVFDDGKTTLSRKLEVVINKIIPFDEMLDDVILNEWRIDVLECDWLYAKETDYFILGAIKIHPKLTYNVTFVRTLDGKWFSIGDNGGLLDVDNSITEKIQSLYF